MNPTSLAPFSCSYTPEVPELLAQLRCSVLLSTYQAGKLLLISPSDDSLLQLARNFRRPMGTALEGNRLAVATQHEVILLENAPALGSSYPRKPAFYDAFFVPRATYFTGAVDLHDMVFAGPRLLAVNTLFSCLCEVGARFSFQPLWKPAFITALAPEDRCHLNGLAMANGKPRFLTALGATDEARAWRADRLGGGVVIETSSGEVVVSGLAMPHSPRLYDDELYVVSAARGELLRVEAESGHVEVVNRVPGFARGLARCGDYLFVGHSRIRKQHAFGDLPIARQEHSAGVVLVHLPSGRIAGAIRYHASCEEIYDVHVMPGILRPGILGLESEMHRRAVTAPQGSWWASEVADPEAKGVAAEARGPSSESENGASTEAR